MNLVPEGTAPETENLTRGPHPAEPHTRGPHPAEPQDPGAVDRLMADIAEQVGTVHGMVLCHAESVDSASWTPRWKVFERHFAVNTRAS
ncbi:hypothetical protein [Arthrobacter sp. ISL-28]|uniref:hypothetical protein n=1 Tax=Arthrobacter sp. ISL-28 TaxID=2819108 RepID=UPI001BEB5FE6|nr:hypothetical protein [Arthrobacter sp. ISL-28]MBT2521438.1 hypothetical protein [Arthrobacter sp. ISL-28]